MHDLKKKTESITTKKKKKVSFKKGKRQIIDMNL